MRGTPTCCGVGRNRVGERRRLLRRPSSQLRCDLVAYETFTVSLDFELDDYLDYLMTESNVGAAVSAGVALTAIRSWCEEGLHQFFRGVLPVEFRSYYACLGQPG